MTSCRSFKRIKTASKTKNISIEYPELSIGLHTSSLPFLNTKFWMVDDMLLHFNLHTTFTYFINSKVENNYLKCMFSSATTCQVHYTYADLLSIANTLNYIQSISDHFLFLENPISTTNITNINEAVAALSDNILTYILTNPPPSMPL